MIPNRPTEYFRLTTWSGLEIALNFLPWAWQARLAAKKLLHNQWRNMWASYDLIIETAGGNFKIMDEHGRVEPTEMRAPVRL